VENVVAAIFKKPAGSVSPKDTTKVSAVSLKDAVKQNADPATLAAASQTQLTALKSAIEEIETVNVLATRAQTASNGLVAARALLATSDWGDFKTQWDVATKTLTKLVATDPAKLGKISDENVLLTWNLVSAQYTQWMSDVDKYSAAKNLTLTLASFDQLSAAIQALTRLPGVELELISEQLQTVKAQPSLGNNAPPPPPTEDGPLSTFIKNTLPQR
jgi:hypothetical protein